MAQKNHFRRFKTAVAITVILQAIFYIPGESEALSRDTVKRPVTTFGRHHEFKTKPEQMQSLKKSHNNKNATVVSSHVYWGQDDFNSLLNAKKLFSFRKFSNKIQMPLKYENKDKMALGNVKALLEAPKILEELYDQYKRKYGKHPEVEGESMAVFKNKLLEIAKHNLEARRGMHLWEMGVNQFTDLTREEFVDRYAGLIPSEVKKSSTRNYRSAPEPKPYRDRANLPSYVNWVEKGRVTRAVENQGNDCKSCVMFALASLVDSANAIATKDEIRPEDKTPRSPQQLLDCAIPDRDVCRSASKFEHVVEYIHQYHLKSRVEYPQDKDFWQKSCTVKAEKRPLSNHLRVFPIPQGEKALKRAVARGPCAVGIIIVADYGKGIYNGAACSGNTTPNHAVLVVGYGTEGPHDYWIIRNSYGSGWGDDGYFRLLRNNNTCKIGTDKMYEAHYPKLPVLSRFPQKYE